MKIQNLDIDKWWDEFLVATDNMKTTSVFKGFLSKKEISLFTMYSLQILQTLSEIKTDKYGYRVFENGKKLNHKEMIRIYNSPPHKGECIKKWGKRVFGNNKFGIIINSGEKFNLELSKHIALKTKPLLKKIGFPQEGINFSIFIGNYGWTPLGVHQDSKGESVIHFHLGPGPKTMYTW